MSETNSNTAPVQDELKTLKHKADLMGIAYSNNISAETLRKKIEDKMEGVTPETAEVNPLEPEAPKKLSKNARRHKMMLEQTRLVRCRITNLDPKKKDLHGEIVTVANPVIGTIRKFIPFGEFTDNGYHIPYILYNFLESRRFLNIRTITDRQTGQLRIESNWAKEFAIEVLPPLNHKQLAELKAAQAAAGGYT